MELVVVDVEKQGPNMVLAAGGAAGCVVVMEPVDAVPVGVLVIVVMPGKTYGATVVLLVTPPNIEDVLLEETVEAGLVVVRD